MKKIINWIVPKEDGFFELLAEQSENVLESAKELKNFVDNYEKFERKERKSKTQLIKDLEHKGSEFAHNIITKLDKGYRTKIDKEDIRQVAVLLDDVLDLINDTASSFVVLSIERIDNYIIKLMNIIHSAVIDVNKSMICLNKLRDIKEHYSKIYKLKNWTDNVYNEAMSELFHFYKNSIDIIKYKEIYGLLKEIAGKCKDIASVIESIAVKHE